MYGKPGTIRTALGQSKLLSGFWSWSDPNEDVGGFSNFVIISLWSFYNPFTHTLWLHHQSILQVKRKFVTQYTL